jgi:integrase
MPRRNSGPRLKWYPKRGNGTYYIAWSEAGRSRERSTGTCVRADAEICLAAFIGSKQTGPRDPGQVLVTAVLADYLRERGPSIIARDRIVHATEALVPFWTGKMIGQITSETCKAYCRKRGVSNGTLRRELGVLSAAINHAHAEGRITRKVAVHRPKRPEARDRWLTRVEAAKLLCATRLRAVYSQASIYRPRYLSLFTLLGLYTGRRKEAILSLRWPQVDLVNATIDFRQSGQIETKKKRGKIPIGPKLLGHLRRARMRGTDLGYVIADRDGNRLGDVKKGFAGAVRRAGLGPDVTPHVLKHTCATWLYHRGETIQDAANFLDTSIATLERVYQHASVERMRKVAGAI